MRICEKCGRPLKDSEHNLCPACQSEKSHKKKKWIEIIGGAATIVGGIVISILTGRKGGGKA